jgi:enolase
VKETIIKRVNYRTIFDSRGVETLEVDVETEHGFGRAAAPFGAPGSRGEFEAPAYSAEGIEGSIRILKQSVIPQLIGADVTERQRIDELLREVDGTPNFERMGGNTSTVISVACAKAAAESLQVPLFKFVEPKGNYTLPYPLGNVIGGGAHSLGPAPDMQEHLVVALGLKSVRQGVRLNLLIHEEVGRLLEKKDPAFAGGTDDENAWTANLNDFEAFEILEEACKKISDQQGVELRIGLDIAADRLWDVKEKVYRYTREGKIRNPQEQLDYLTALVERFRMIYVEDGFHSNDYEAFAALNQRVGAKCIVCADDIYATNPQGEGGGRDDRQNQPGGHHHGSGKHHAAGAKAWRGGGAVASLRRDRRRLHRAPRRGLECADDQDRRQRRRAALEVERPDARRGGVRHQAGGVAAAVEVRLSAVR